MNPKPASGRPDFWSAVSIVAKREIVARFLSKSFLISTAVILAFMLIVVVFTPQIGDFFSGGDSTVATTQELATKFSGLEKVTFEVVADEETAKDLVRQEKVDSALLSDSSNAVGLKIVGLRDTNTSLVEQLSSSPTVELLDPDAPHPAIKILIAIGFGVVWMTAGITFGMSIAQSVVEEKQTRIVEILLASISSRALLTGKIVGNSAAAFVQIALMTATALIGLAINGESFPVAKLQLPIFWFVVLFLFGFVMVAALYAATAALVSRTEDLNTALQPLIWLIMLPYFLIMFAVNSPLMLTIMSYIPFSAPVAVPVRIFTTETSLWEPLASLGLLVITTVVLIGFAAKVYDRALLRIGKPVKLSEALKAEN